MKKVRESKDVKGITLLALVITIIILLILAGIAINLSFGEGGVLSETKEAVNAWTKGEEDEKSELTKLGNEMKGIREELIPPKVEGLKEGDYVKYKAGNNGEQGEIMCKVLYTADSEYGLQIAAINSVEEITLGVYTTNWSEARDAYNNLVKTLNEKAEEYINPIYTENGENGVKGARCIGNPIKMEDKNEEATKETVILPDPSWDSWTKPDGWKDGDTGCLELSSVVEGNQGYVCLPARCLEVNDTNFYFEAYFQIGENRYLRQPLILVRKDGQWSPRTIKDKGFIPVLSLKPNVKLIKGDGATKETAYELGI